MAAPRTEGVPVRGLGRGRLEEVPVRGRGLGRGRLETRSHGPAIQSLILTAKG